MTIYVKAHRDELMIVALYLDDLIFMSNNQRLIYEFEQVIKLQFEMTNVRMMRYFLSPKIKKEKSIILVS
jgi:Reverse transcriptase (RNA-dependent DNA polymerase)